MGFLEIFVFVKNVCAKILAKVAADKILQRLNFDEANKEQIVPGNVIKRELDIELQESINKSNSFESSRRLHEVSKLLFQNEFCTDYPLSKVAYDLNLIKESDLSAYLKSEKEPSFKFLENFSQTYGVQKEWLLFGKGKPFEVGENQLYATNYIPKITALNPKRVFLIREKCRPCRTGIILQINEWDFVTLGKTYHISSEVGETGSIQIEEFYHFLTKIKKQGFYGCIQGKLADTEVFEKLFSGKISPKILDTYRDNNSLQNSPWVDDFMDYNHLSQMAENYERWYGNEFIKAQKILRILLKKVI